jgi:hypothetical protein
VGVLLLLNQIEPGDLVADPLIQRGMQERPGAPEVEYFDGALTSEEMAGLYTACDCLTHPLSYSSLDRRCSEGRRDPLRSVARAERGAT